MLDAWTLKKLLRRVKEFTRATTLEASGFNVFKILTFGLGREQRNLTFDQSSIVRNFRKGRSYNLHVLGKPNKRKSDLKLGIEKSYSRTKVKWIHFQRRVHMQQSVYVNGRDKYNHINSDQC